MCVFQVRDTADTVDRSGNPGYQVGKNLLYGTLNETTNPDGVTTYPFELATLDQGLKPKYIRKLWKLRLACTSTI